MPFFRLVLFWVLVGCWFLFYVDQFILVARQVKEQRMNKGKQYSFGNVDGAYEEPKLVPETVDADGEFKLSEPIPRVINATLASVEVDLTTAEDVRLKWTNTNGEGGQLVFTPTQAIEVASMLLNFAIQSKRNRDQRAQNLKFSSPR